MSESGTTTPGIKRGAQISQEQEHHHDDERDRNHHGEFDVMHRGADGGGAVEDYGEVDRGRDRSAQLGQRGVDSIDGIDNVRAGLAENDNQHCRLAIDHPGGADVLDRVSYQPDVGKLNGGAVVVAHDQRLVILGLEQLIGRAQAPGLFVIGQLALGPVRIGIGQHSSHVLETDAEVAHLRWIQFNADAGQRTAADIDLADAVDLRELLLEDRVCSVVHQSRPHGGRGQAENHDRCVGRIDLSIGRLARQCRRQLAGGGVDGGLHVARGGVDIAVQVELQNDAGGAEIAGRSQFRQVGDTAELALERSRHRRGHRLGTRAGQRRLDLYRGELDLRQWRDRQQPERDHAGERKRNGQQRGGDRLPYEDFGNTHDA